MLRLVALSAHRGTPHVDDSNFE
uniref:Uncharacterized protein n=1 Tax=Arundo donax TaxID=35708 RepID=A0A0A9FJN9_ARUDO